MLAGATLVIEISGDDLWAVLLEFRNGRKYFLISCFSSGATEEILVV